MPAKTDKKKTAKKSTKKKGSRNIIKKLLKKKWARWVLLGTIIATVVAGVLVGGYSAQEPPAEPVVISQSLLEEIVHISNISTYEAVYNGIATVMNEKKPEKVDYYVSYEARILVGFDFQDIGVQLNESDKLITLTIPKVKINDIDVDFSSMDFIFINDRMNDSTVTEKAYKACKTDATREAAEDQAVLEFAQEAANNFVDALIRPFVEQMDSGYKIVLKQEGQV